MADFTFMLVIAATAVHGIALGATLDQSIKQLPARHRMGVVAYSAYSLAADMGNGLIWYPILGMSTVLLNMAAALAAIFQNIDSTHATPIFIAAVLSILTTLITGIRAAPIMWSQRRYTTDEQALTAVFSRFEHWQTLRSLVELLTFGAVLWALVTFLR